MRLIVSSNREEQLDQSLDTIIISPEEFNNYELHVWILTQGFSEVYIDIDDRLDKICLRMLSQRLRVCALWRGTIDKNALENLATIYSSKASALKYFYYRDKDKFNEQIKELSENYDWILLKPVGDII